MSKADLIKLKRGEILRIAEQFGAFNVRLFGSVARGEATPDSDIDFLVDMQPNRSLLDVGGLVMALKSMLNSEVDVVTEKGLRDRLRPRVLSEAIPL